MRVLFKEIRKHPKKSKENTKWDSSSKPADLRQALAFIFFSMLVNSRSFHVYEFKASRSVSFISWQVGDLLIISGQFGISLHLSSSHLCNQLDLVQVNQAAHSCVVPSVILGPEEAVLVLSGATYPYPEFNV